MEDDLLIKLHKYRPREKKNPKENFFTEAIAFAYRNVSGLSDEILSVLLPDNLEGRVVDVQTQQTHNGSQIDLEITFANENKLLCEHKIEADIHYVNDEEMVDKTQLDRYLEIAEKNDWNVLLISPYDLGIDKRVKDNPRFLGDFRWSEIYSITAEYLRRKTDSEDISDLESFVLQTVLRFMEEENMQPGEKFENEDIGRLKGYEEFRNKLRKFLDEVLKEMKDEYDIEYDGRKHEGTQYYYGLFQAEDTKCWISISYNSDWFLDPILSVYDDLRGKEEELEKHGFYYDDKSYNLDMDLPDGFLDWNFEKQVETFCNFFRKGLDTLVKLDFIRKR